MGRAARTSREEAGEEPGLVGPTEAGRPLAVFGQGKQEPVQRWRDLDGVGAEGQSDALPGLDDVAGGEARDLGEGLAAEEDEQERATRNGVIALATLSGTMAVTAPAYADSVADGAAADSPGLVSGNSIRLPVHVPVNACGNTVSVVGLLNPAAGNSCTEESAEKKSAGESGGAISAGSTQDSPGVASGIGIQVPVDLPVNVSGNTVNVVGVGNPVLGDASVSGDEPVEPPSQPDRSVPEPVDQGPPPFIGDPLEPPMTHADPHATHRAAQQQVAHSHLADTGTDGMVPAAAVSAALVLGSAALRRRFRSPRS